MVHERWSDSTTHEFVKLYLKHVCLWDPTNPGYTKQRLRQSAYAELAKEFKEFSGKSLTPYEVTLKVKNLRTTYMQQVNKIIKSAMQPGHVHKPSIVWFDEMDKCLSHLGKLRKNSHKNRNADLKKSCPNAAYFQLAEEDSNLIDDAYSETDLSTNEPTVETFQEPIVQNVEEQLDKNAKMDLPKVSVKKQSKQWDNSKFKSRKKKAKYKKDHTVMLKPPRAREIEDEFDVYGRYIASQLRKLDMKMALHIQMKIQWLMCDARLSKDSEDDN